MLTCSLYIYTLIYISVSYLWTLLLLGNIRAPLSLQLEMCKNSEQVMKRSDVRWRQSSSFISAVWCCLLWEGGNLYQRSKVTSGFPKNKQEKVVKESSCVRVCDFIGNVCYRERGVSSSLCLGNLLTRNSITDLTNNKRVCLISVPAAQIIEPNGSPVLEDDESTCTLTGLYYK